MGTRFEERSPEFHCVKIVRIWSYSGPHFSAFGLNNSEYGHFLCSVNLLKLKFTYLQVYVSMYNFVADLITFTEEVLNGKLYIMHSVSLPMIPFNLQENLRNP